MTLRSDLIKVITAYDALVEDNQSRGNLAETGTPEQRASIRWEVMHELAEVAEDLENDAAIAGLPRFADGSLTDGYMDLLAKLAHAYVDAARYEAGLELNARPGA